MPLLLPPYSLRHEDPPSDYFRNTRPTVCASKHRNFRPPGQHQMFSRVTLAILVVFVFGSSVFAQAERRPSPSPSPTPANEEQDSVKIFTEEVRLPVVAVDQFGNYDPTLELDDVLVLEDGVAQQIRSIRHLPASV